MNWDNVREGQLKDVFDILQAAFAELGIDYYLIGAVARNIWYARENKSFRVTKDVDFAVFVGNHDEYEEIRNYLKDRKGFRVTNGNSFVLLTPSGMQVDILPFGGIEIDGGVNIRGVGLTNINVNGFMEVYSNGTASVIPESGHPFKIATLPSIVLLKLIAFDDRPEARAKDARDIGNLIQHYFDLQADFIYEHHADLFSMDDEQLAEQSLVEISAIVIGREIKKIIQQNSALQQRVQGIVQTLLTQKDQSAFIREVVNETKQPVAEVVKWLKKLSEGLEYDYQ